jgi:hypothetical protein
MNLPQLKFAMAGAINVMLWKLETNDDDANDKISKILSEAQPALMTNNPSKNRARTQLKSIPSSQSSGYALTQFQTNSVFTK